ncbi:protein REVERSION-TO-ETHYLENE SENSITIVITY1 [Typha angustifolia]|uniref:protein REVERSION-TO-ETHYLENE SENSITIVITY1 n=1 Tax=Typha angustifolia TaxID=59011 RepID=UPI003C2EEF84
MSLRVLTLMELEAAVDSRDANSDQGMHGNLWPLDEVDPKRAKYPCCIVWTPLPVVSWLAPYIGHVGICREDGTVLDFAGSNFVNIDSFAYGAVARYLQLDRKKCCFPPNLGAHVCEQSYKHAEQGTAISWDDALRSSMQHFQHKYYNLFTCNCHSFVANCLNQLAYDRSLGWNMVNLAPLILWRGKWVDWMSVFRAFSPFVTVLCIGILMAGWPFLIGMAVFSFLLLGWFLCGIYCVKGLIV